MESLQTSKTEETRLAKIRTAGSSISVLDCVTSTALKCSPYKEEYILLIGKGISKMFFLHGKKFSTDIIKFYTEAIIEIYDYETPETIIKFFNKAAAGDFGKFYGDPDIGTIREWFADFLQQHIIPAREDQNRRGASGSNDRNSSKGFQPVKQIYSKVTKEKEFEKGKVRKL